MARLRGVPHNHKGIAPSVIPVMRVLLEAQEAAGMTDRELGDRAGYAYQNLANWRCGRGTPSMTTMSEFAQVLGLELRLMPRERSE